MANGLLFQVLLRGLPPADSLRLVQDSEDVEVQGYVLMVCAMG